LNAELLKRLFRAISEGTDSSIESVCKVILDDVKKKNQTHLAKQLELILSSRRHGAVSAPQESSKQPGHLRAIPKIRQLKGSLITVENCKGLDTTMVLVDAVEERFIRIEKEFAARSRLGHFGLKPIKKILLYGAPGCGKTLGAKRLSRNTGLPLYKVRFDSMLSSYFGESASNLRAIFDECLENPCILLLDECDFIARSRKNSKDVGEVPRIANTLLQLLEDYDLPGLVIATTNIQEELDLALFRRFDEAFEIPLPGNIEIQKLLQSTLATMKQDLDVSWPDLASQLKGHSAADVVKCAQNAAKLGVLDGSNVVKLEHLNRAVSELFSISRDK
jgi:SpoVK/Ycf46/Vps4 family AAA+-type ATPase